MANDWEEGAGLVCADSYMLSTLGSVSIEMKSGASLDIAPVARWAMGRRARAFLDGKCFEGREVRSMEQGTRFWPIDPSHVRPV